MSLLRLFFGIPNLSNQDRELQKQAILSAHECTESGILLFTCNGGTGKATSDALPFETGQAM